MIESIDDVLGDLVAEFDRLESVLSVLDDAQWASPSGAPGWTVTDVVVHLAQTEEGVAATLANPEAVWTTRDGLLDDAVAARVRVEAAPPSAVFARWRAARRASVDALARADPTVYVRWAAAPLKPRTLATTRLAEHWAHGLDITEPLGVPFPDTERLRHIAWLGHATLPYAMRLAGLEPQAVRCTLHSPAGATWAFGPADAPSSVSGPGAAFCRVGARRLAASESGLLTSGPHADDALRVLRNYAA